MSEPGPVEALVREADFGRWASTLFAPAETRVHLLALYAFDIELARTPDLVSEPMPGELRLQWWRDALENPGRADVASHPTAKALHEAIAFGRLPVEALVSIIDARVDDLYDDPVATLDDLEARLGATHSAILRLASLIAAEGRDPGGAQACGFAGVASGISRALATLPKLAQRGRTLLPGDLMAKTGVRLDDLLSGRPTPEIAGCMRSLAAHGLSRLAEARAAAGSMDEAGAPALLPVALVQKELERFERRPAPFGPVQQTPRWRELLRLWRCSRRDPPF